MWRIGIIFTLLLALVGVGGGSKPQPAAAQDGASWKADFYNNGFQIEPSVLTSTSGALAFNWGQGSPGAAVNSDNFSARFGADPFMAGGTYRFFLLADDGANVTIDLTNVFIKTYDENKAGQLITADLTISPGQHHFQVDYNEKQGEAYIYFTWVNLATNPNPTVNFGAPTPNVNVGLLNPWTAQYYSNPALSGPTPTLTRTETSPNNSWGSGSPDATIAADNFSARWTSNQNLTGGSYQMNVRADDGFRVIINGTTYLNQFTVGPQSVTTTINLPAGQNTFVLEYYEATGNAFFEFSLTIPTTGQPAPSNPTTPSGATVTVNTGRLNVRSLPSNSGQILTRVSRGETYAVIARSADGFWWQINVNGTVGWVSNTYVRTNNVSNVPVGSGSVSTPANTGYTLSSVYRVNIRSGAGSAFSVTAVLPRAAIANIVGRSADNRWWQINYNGIIGWVSATYTTPNTTVDYARVPVTG